MWTWPTSSTPWAPTSWAPAPTSSRSRAWRRSTAAPTPSSPTRSRPVPIWPPWPPTGGQRAHPQRHPQAHGLHHRQAGGDGRHGGGIGRRRPGGPRPGRLQRTNVKTHALSRLPHGYAAPDRRGAVPGPGYQHRHRERIRDNRFKYVDELQPHGRGHLRWTASVAVIEGVGHLMGAPVRACDLRAGAALVIAGLCRPWAPPRWPGHPLHRAGLRGPGGQAPGRGRGYPSWRRSPRSAQERAEAHIG